MTSVPLFRDYADRWFAFDVETGGDGPQLPMEFALQPWNDRGELRSFSIAYTVEIGRDDKLPRRIPVNASEHLYGIRGELGLENIRSSYRDISDVGRMHKALANFMKTNANRNHRTAYNRVIAWNAPFDAAWCIAMGHREEVLETKWLDPMLLWKHLTRVPESDLVRGKRKSYSLKAAVAEFFPEWAGYEDNVDLSDWNTDEGRKRIERYNRLDAEFTLLLTELFWNELRHHPRQWRNAMLEASTIPLVADAYITGIHIDYAAARALDKEVAEQMREKTAELLEIGVAPNVVASPAQLQKLLFDDWQLPVISHTDKGARSTDKETLYELSLIDDRVGLIQQARELKNLRTKFVTKIMESVDYNGDGCSHPTANIYSTYTGRMTFGSSLGTGKAKRQTGFAIHQMKRSPVYRRVVDAPPGFSIVEWDAAGQEFRWMAIESGDETMLALCEPGEDAHSFMGAEINPEFTYQQLAEEADHNPQAYEVRQMGKVGNLSCQYRIGPKSLLRTARVQYGMDIDITRSQLIHNTYHHTYRGVKQYWKRKVRDAQHNGYAETLAGRRVILQGHWSGPDAWKLESTAINFPIQGIGADQKYLAMLSIKPLLTKYGGKFYFELHDGLYVIFPDKVAEKAAIEGQRILSDLPYKKAWGFTPPIPLPWDAKLGKNWGDSKKVGG